MTRRDFRTPPSLPETTETRCITIPASQPWLGLVNAALLMLTEEWRYDQVEETDMTAEATAARAMLMYVEYLGACDVACCPMRINPFTGRLQQSDDDGLTWFDVPDGPWDTEDYPPFSGMPMPRPESGDDPKKCAAAATGAYTLVNLYAQTGNTLLNVVAATDWEYAGALGAMLQGFLLMIGMAAVQPFVALASLLGIVGVKEQYLDYPLDSDDELRLTCILLENATLQASGAVTFDFQAVWDAIDLDSPKNGLVRFLLTMIGPDALNYAGAIDAGITPDCDDCFDDCENYSDYFATGLGPQTSIINGTYTGSGGVTGNGYINGVDVGAPFNRAFVRVDLLDVCTVEYISFWGKKSLGSAGFAALYWYCYDASDTLLASGSGTLSSIDGWQQGNFDMSVAGVSYVTLLAEGNSVGIALDDLDITVA